jgi:hypothetical protein
MDRAGDLMHRAALMLLATARRRGGFPVHAEELSPELKRISMRLEEAGAGFVFEAEPRSLDRIGLNCRRGGETLSVILHIDGVLEDESFDFGAGFARPDGGGDPPPSARREAPAAFQGTEFVRAVAAEPQRGAAIRILAAELFADGLVVHYQYEDGADVMPVPPPSVSVNDDLGTRYRETGAEVAGLRVKRGSARFTPSVPATAQELRVTTYAGEVSMNLAPA